MNTLEKIENNTAIIGIVGLGYVGLPLMLAYTAKGYRCIGFDIDQTKIDFLERGESYIEHIDSTPINDAVVKKTFEATTDFSRISEVEAIILCVPTPLDQHY